MKSLGPPEPNPGVEPPLEADSALEPVRLLAGAGGAFERRLLASAAEDAMPAAALQQLAQALHVPSSALPTLGAELQRTAWLGKYLALAGLGALGVVASVVASGGRVTPARTEPVAIAAVVAPAPTPAPEAVSPAEVSRAEVSRAEVSRAEVSRAEVSRAEVSRAEVPRIDVAQTEPARPKIATPRSRASAHAAAQPRRSTAQGLRAELQALEAVQSALRAQHAERAADALAAYSRRFPAGELEREAELLGVDIALARGDRQLARARARELLSKPDGARYRERLDALRIESSGSPHGSPEVIR
jgi:hypothetical protein